jgi:hypothetical protein
MIDGRSDKWEIDRPHNIGHIPEGCTAIDNQIVNDTRLSWTAKGILVYLLSRPDSPIVMRELEGGSSQGRTAVRTAAKLLKGLGYLRRKEHSGTGFTTAYLLRKRNALGYDYTTDEMIRGRWEMFGNLCWICGEPATATDHVKPLSKGGSHYPANLRPICKRCNSSKGNKWPYPIQADRA